MRSNPPESLEALLDETRQLTDARLNARAELLKQDPGGKDGEALAYALGTSGKRVRPALVIASYRAALNFRPHRPHRPHRPTAAIAAIATAVEIVHTYSLVHDDLPCMDNDAQRRGRPTVHVQFDAPTATRAGFLLVPVAIEELADGAALLGLDAQTFGRMAELLLEASGIRGMVGGQWLDLNAEGRRPTLDELLEIHHRKTGALIEAACTLGALSAQAPNALRQALSAYGREIGLAFQIADDLLDATATSEELGKTAGRDATLAKATSVSVLGIEGARQEALRLAERARSALRDAGIVSPALEGLADYIVLRRS